MEVPRCFLRGCDWAAGRMDSLWFCGTVDMNNILSLVEPFRWPTCPMRFVAFARCLFLSFMPKMQIHVQTH
ncbi:hypothetical protein Pan258_52900 [Symmachiella dynata]|nr:hypothetical protein Pan258_52900 [Symmachiella dynata]